MTRTTRCTTATLAAAVVTLALAPAAVAGIAQGPGPVAPQVQAVLERFETKEFRVEQAHDLLANVNDPEFATVLAANLRRDQERLHALEAQAGALDGRSDGIVDGILDGDAEQRLDTIAAMVEAAHPLRRYRAASNAADEIDALETRVGRFDGIVIDDTRLDAKTDRLADRIDTLSKSLLDIRAFTAADDARDVLASAGKVTQRFSEVREDAPLTQIDRDHDTLSDAREAAIGTNPKVADTDHDGVLDGTEVRAGADPRSAPVPQAPAPQTPKPEPTPAAPNAIDTDGDGLSDVDEVTLHHTSPTNPDTDDDLLGDGDEVAVHHTDPRDPDTDDDLLNDGEEVGYGKTDPNNPDTDGDGIDDNIEILTGGAETRWGLPGAT